MAFCADRSRAHTLPSGSAGQAITAPLAGSAHSQLLMTAPIGWVCAMLACLLSLTRLFAADLADGTLEQMLLAQMPFTAIVCGKSGAHWLPTGWPLMLCTPLVGVQFGLGASELAVLLVTLALGTPVLSLLGGIMSALTLASRGGAALSKATSRSWARS